MRAETGTFGGDRFPRMQMKVYDLDDEAQFAQFARGEHSAN